MGVCTSDPLGYLIKEYGADVCKYIVSIKAEDYVDDAVPKITKKVQQQFKNTAGHLDKEFDQKENAIKGNFDSVITDVRKSNPSALQKAKQAQQKSEEQLLGFDSIQTQFSKIKATKDAKLKDQETSILNGLKQRSEEVKENIKSSRPSLPLFDNMPICIRQKVLSEGEERFAPEVKKKQNEISELFDKITNLGDLEGNIKKVAGLNEADKLVKTSSSTFEKGKKLISVINDPSAGMKACC